MWERIRVIIIKEFKQTLRESRMRVLLFLPPIVQLLIFGFAVNMDLDLARIGWMDMDRTPLSRELLAKFEGSGRFEVVAVAYTEDDVQRILDRGEAYAVIRVLPNFERDVKRGESAQVQVLIDGSNSNTASLVSNYAGQVISQFSSGLVRVQNVPRVVARSRVWFNPDLYSRNYFVPGVVANII